MSSFTDAVTRVRSDIEAILIEAGYSWFIRQTDKGRETKNQSFELVLGNSENTIKTQRATWVDVSVELKYILRCNVTGKNAEEVFTTSLALAELKNSVAIFLARELYNVPISSVSLTENGLSTDKDNFVTCSFTVQLTIQIKD